MIRKSGHRFSEEIMLENEERSHIDRGSQAMGRAFRFKLRMRRFSRRHSRIIFVVRSFLVFAAAFAAAYGFAVGSMSRQAGYDPHTFAIGASFLFAIASVGLASL